MKRKSMSYIHKTGDIPSNWVLDEKFSDYAQRSLYFAKLIKETPATVLVYRNRSKNCFGRCYKKIGVIVLDQDAGLKTLAHEVAHFAYDSHGPRLRALEKKIESFYAGMKFESGKSLQDIIAKIPKINHWGVA